MYEMYGLQKKDTEQRQVASPTGYRYFHKKFSAIDAYRKKKMT